MRKCNEFKKSKQADLRKRYLEVKEKIYLSPIAVTLEEIKLYHKYKNDFELKIKKIEKTNRK
ncbi:hypothetical protein NRK67_02285 [Fusobacteria bacterium ZRK30]|nr:hypothetical protein NRK67_02285 [Fusobacteria bacterium ZRK30]